MLLSLGPAPLPWRGAFCCSAETQSRRVERQRQMTRGKLSANKHLKARYGRTGAPEKEREPKTRRRARAKSSTRHCDGRPMLDRLLACRHVETNAQRLWNPGTRETPKLQDGHHRRWQPDRIMNLAQHLATARASSIAAVFTVACVPGSLEQQAGVEAGRHLARRRRPFPHGFAYGRFALDFLCKAAF